MDNASGFCDSVARNGVDREKLRASDLIRSERRARIRNPAFASRSGAQDSEGGLFDRGSGQLRLGKLSRGDQPVGKIRVLPQVLLNQIAAGEVIERPASVVKELVENALDAGATSIRIRLEEGGKKGIVVSDDGKGIDAADIPLVFSSHATSKIQTVEDLFSIRTLGFRGEALSSIGAVSEARLVSRAKGASEAMEITCAGGKRSDPRPAGAPPGTTVEVTNLFFNVPARRRFLRTAHTELSHAVDWVTRASLAHPAVRWDLTHTDESILCVLPTDSIGRRIRDLFPEDITIGIEEYREQWEGMDLSLWLGKADSSFPGTRYQYFFVNGRAIRDRLLSRAMRDAGRDLLPEGRSPAAFLFLEVDPREVDVNVHPTKAEVRFRRAWPLFEFLLGVARKALGASPEAIAFSPRLSWESYLRTGDAARRDELRREIAAYIHAPLSPSTSHRVEGAPEGPRPGEVFPEIPGVLESLAHAPDPSGGRYVQLHHRYIVEEVPDGLLIIDQHALHEGILVWRYREVLSRQPVPRQRLLLPAVVDLAAAEHALLREMLPAFEQIGYEISEFGSRSVALHAVPDYLGRREPAAVFAETLRSLAESGWARPWQESQDEIVARAACTAAIKAGDPLEPEELQELMRLRSTVQSARACAHGRPTSLLLTHQELDRHFGRK